jgi:hypothetical protein
VLRALKQRPEDSVPLVLLKFSHRIPKKTKGNRIRDINLHLRNVLSPKLRVNSEILAISRKLGEEKEVSG